MYIVWLLTLTSLNWIEIGRQQAGRQASKQKREYFQPCKCLLLLLLSSSTRRAQRRKEGERDEKGIKFKYIMNAVVLLQLIHEKNEREKNIRIFRAQKEAAREER